MPYSHFTLDERIILLQLLKKQYSLRNISDILGRNVSSISRELSRNTVNGSYNPYVATSLAYNRRKDTIKAIAPGSKKWFYVVEKLNNYWSPEQIAARWNKDFPLEKPLSFSTIYRYIYRHLLPNISSEKNLRRRGKFQRPDKAMYNSVKPDRHIHEWSDVIKKRQRIGDWEGDSVLGGVGKGLALTLVDRKSRFLVSTISLTKKASTSADAIANILKDYPVHSITFDNGVEFSEFHTIEQKLKTKVYFAEPHKPWQRGTNENTNGILRFFFERGFDFRTITEEEFQRVVDLINNRPRRCLGWKTPAEVYSESVALG